MRKIGEAAQGQQDRIAVSDLQIKYTSEYKVSELQQIKSSKDVERIARANWQGMPIEFVEQFYLLGLNRANKVKFIQSISTGGVSGTVVDLKVIAIMLLQGLCCACALVHNHPSGTMQPSQNDINITKKIKAGLDLLDIKVIDHVILSPEEGFYYSFADEGMI